MLHLLRTLKYSSCYFNKPSVKCINLNQIKSSYSQTNVNTNVTKDVILYKHDNPKYFNMLNIFALCQFGFWNYLGIFAYTSLKDAPSKSTDKDVAWWRKVNLGENKYRNSLGIVSCVLGTGILLLSWMYCLRSVRYLILHKGGTNATFVTYGPFGFNNTLKVSLQNVSCKENRTSALAHLPIKIREKSWHYILDMKGEFKHPALFDSTAGLCRLWKNK